MNKENYGWWILLVVAVVLLLSGLGWGTYGMMGTGWGMMGFGVMFLPMLLFWGAVIWLVVTLVNSAGKSREEREERGSPLEILKKRFAKGELTKRQYEEIKKELR